MNTTTHLSREEEEKAAVLAGKWENNEPSEQDLEDYLTGNLTTERPN